MKKILILLGLFSFILCIGQSPVDKTVQINPSFNDIPLNFTCIWDSPDPENFLVYRKHPDSSSWGDPIATLPSDAGDFSDLTMEKSKVYEYKFYKSNISVNGETSVMSGVEVPAIEDRGKVILLVDSTFVNSLFDEIKLLENDLIGDGWQVLRKDISRTASVRYVKSRLVEFYNADPDKVKAILILGHVPVPYSGNMAPDGHGDHVGAWSADVYYGDMDESGWTDVSINTTTAARAANHNVPGDGKFDQNSIPGPNNKLELQVGRIDMWNLDKFSESEEELLRRYLAKNHKYRHAYFRPPQKALIQDNFGYFSGSAFAGSGWRSFAALVGADNIEVGEYTQLDNEKYLFNYGCGPGLGYDSSRFVVGTHNFASQKFHSVFSMLFGSYFGDFDAPNDLLRASLASEGWTLSNCWSGWPSWTFHQMGIGYTLGYSAIKTQNSTSSNPYMAGSHAGGVHANLLGDPTLRLHMVQPPLAFQGAEEGAVNKLFWVKSKDEVLNYVIYKLDTAINQYIELERLPANDSTWEDSTPFTGNNYYMLKSYKLQESVSGSYYNYSQGVFDTVNNLGNSMVLVNSLDVSASVNYINEDKGNLQMKVQILPTTVSIDAVRWSIESVGGLAAIDRDGNVQGIANGDVIIKAEAIDGSGIWDTMTISIINQINPIQSIEVNSISGDSVITIGQSIAFQAEFFPNFADSKDIIWSVLRDPDNLGEASISDVGILTPEAAGHILVVALVYETKETIIGFYRLRIEEESTQVIHDNVEIDVMIYPCPVKELLHIQLMNNLSSAFVQVIDIHGAIMKQEEIVIGENEIEVSALPRGIYFVKIINNSLCETEMIIFE